MPERPSATEQRKRLMPTCSPNAPDAPCKPYENPDGSRTCATCGYTEPSPGEDWKPGDPRIFGKHEREAVIEIRDFDALLQHTRGVEDALAREREAREKFQDLVEQTVRLYALRGAVVEGLQERLERAEALKNVARLLERRGLFTRHAGNLTDDGEYIELRVPKQLFDEIGDALRKALVSLPPPQEKRECTCTEKDESSGGSATYEDNPFCPIHGRDPTAVDHGIDGSGDSALQ